MAQIVSDGATPPGGGSFYPLTAQRTGTKFWDIVYSRNYLVAANQVMGTGITGGGTVTPPPPPPPPTAATTATAATRRVHDAIFLRVTRRGDVRERRMVATRFRRRRWWRRRHRLRDARSLRVAGRGNLPERWTAAPRFHYQADNVGFPRRHSNT